MSEFDHLRYLPDGYLTQAEVTVLVNRINELTETAGKHDPTGADHMEEMWKHAQRADQAESLLGDLIDALNDEVRYEVSQSSHVIDHIDRACRHLGGSYEAYVGSWL